jgi:integrase
MIIRMARPKRRDRGSYVARIKVPRKLRDAHARYYGARYAVEESWPAHLSPEEANEACATWVKSIRARFKALAKGQSGHLDVLTHRDAAALVGLWYREFLARHEPAPGNETDLNAALDAHLMDEPEPEEVAGQLKADAWLASKGYALDPASRTLFIEILAERYPDALVLLLRRARGDYGPDPIAAVFPTLEPASIKNASAVSIRALFDQWRERTRPAAGTVRRWAAVIDAANAKFPDLRHVSKTQAREWLQSLITPERSAYTVRRVWLTALNAICTWSIEQELLPANPFAGLGRAIDVPDKIETRETKAFTDSEAAMILRAALAVEGDPARRWLPWLCAYSGARAGEVAQLRGQDIVERDGIHAFVITPQAGTVKNKKPRTIPLHEHIIEQGFLDFVQSRGKGPLFYEPRKDNKARKEPPSDDVVSAVGEWVRSLGVSDPRVGPNHGWRHLFKLIAERAGVPDRLNDVIAGHKPVSVGRAYGQPTLSDLAREIKKLPRYQV